MKKKLSLNKETVARLNEQQMKQVKGGATPTWFVGSAIAAGLATVIHDYGDNQSWWHCTVDTACCPSEEAGCGGIANPGSNSGTDVAKATIKKA